MRTGRYGYIAVICLSAVGLLLFSRCGGTPDDTIGLEVLSVTGTSVEVTLTPCPPVTPVSVAAPCSDPATLLYVLVDRSMSYCEWVRPSLELLAGLLPEVVSPGDRVVMAWISNASERPAEVFFQEYVPDVGVPAVDPQPQPPSCVCTPAPPANSTPLPDEETELLGHVHRQALTATAQWYEERWEQCEEEWQRRMSEYSCQLQAWNLSVQQAVRRWDEDREEAVDRFLEQAVPTIEMQAQLTRCSQGTHIREALYVASVVLQNAVGDGGFQHYRLLVLSDMWEDRVTELPEIPIDLGNVDVVVAMMYCSEAADCADRQHRWEEELNMANAQSIAFRLVVDSTVQGLAELLGR